MLYGLPHTQRHLAKEFSYQHELLKVACNEIKCVALTKHSLALKKRFLGVNERLHVTHRTLSLYVSGPSASQTDRRKTVACYIINTGIIKI